MKVAAVIALCAVFSGCRCAKERMLASTADAAPEASAPITFAPAHRIVLNGSGGGPDDVPSGCASSKSGAWRCWSSDGGTVRRVARFPELDAAREVALGWKHACVIRNDGNVLCWGDNQGGQIGDGTEDDAPKPKLVGLRGAVRIASDDFRTCVMLEDESLYCWGNELVGMQIRSGLRSPSKPDPALTAGNGLVDLAFVRTSWCVVNRNGYLTCEKDPYIHAPPAHTTFERPIGRLAVSEKDIWNFAYCFLEPEHALWCIPQHQGTNGDWVKIASSVKDVVAFRDHAYALEEDGHVLALDDVVTISPDAGATIARPRRVAGVDHAVDIAGGDYDRTCVLKEDDSIWCWTERDPTPRAIAF